MMAFEERPHSVAGVFELDLGVAELGAGVNDGKSNYGSSVACSDWNRIEHLVEHLVRRGVLAIDLVDHDNRLRARSSALRSTKRVCACGPSPASSTSKTPSIMFMIRSFAAEIGRPGDRRCSRGNAGI